MNYEYERQNNRQVTEDCTGATMNNVFEAGNNGQLRLNHAHMREKNTHTRENNGHIICISNNNHFLPTWHLIGGLIYLKFHLQKV